MVRGHLRGARVPLDAASLRQENRGKKETSRIHSLRSSILFFTHNQWHRSWLRVLLKENQEETPRVRGLAGSGFVFCYYRRPPKTVKHVSGGGGDEDEL